ncbi:MAG: peptidase C45 [Tetrasphaera sp.]|nr:peptidase C45 [Tetrasphaera sp.]
MRTLTIPQPPRDVTDWRGWIDYGLAYAAAYPARPAPARQDAPVHQPAASPRPTTIHRPETRATTRPTTRPTTRATTRATTASATARTQHATPIGEAAPALVLTMHAYREATPGARWQALAGATWPAYDGWFRARPAGAMPTLRESREALRRHLPALVPTWEHLVDLAAQTTGATPEDAGRLLSLWRPTPFLSGCSQIALTDPEPVLVRSYDYDPRLFEGVVASTNYSGSRRVIGTSDCLWGLVDGMNEDGLAISLTYGGRPGSGVGFGIPLVLRALLEECGDVAEAVRRIRTIPVAQAYNVTVVDRDGAAATVFVAPGEDAHVSTQTVATNQRLDVVEYPAAAASIRSPERHAALSRLAADRAPAKVVVPAFLSDPVRATRYDIGFGSLYAAAYHPRAGTLDYHWPGRTWTRRFDDPDETITVEVPGAQSPGGCRGPRPDGRAGGRRTHRGHARS